MRAVYMGCLVVKNMEVSKGLPVSTLAGLNKVFIIIIYIIIY